MFPVQKSSLQRCLISDNICVSITYNFASFFLRHIATFIFYALTLSECQSTLRTYIQGAN